MSKTAYEILHPYKSEVDAFLTLIYSAETEKEKGERAADYTIYVVKRVQEALAKEA